MTDERFLVTGSSGCLGAWVVAHLARSGVPVIALDISEDLRRLELIASSVELAAVDFRVGDVTDGETLAALTAAEAITHIVHLAALQVPFCAADPVRGAQVNVVGTINVFEAARRAATVRGLSYASSAAVFGPPEAYPDGVAADDSAPAPQTLYGVYKLANEGSARLYARDYGVGSVGLRPCIVYGPGRDQGLTSDITTAIVAAVAGVPYRIGFGGTSTFQHAADAAALFIATARTATGDAAIVNMGGPAAPIADVVAAIEAHTGTAGLITHAGKALPLPGGFDAAGLDALLGAPFPYLSLDAGIGRAVAEIGDLLVRGAVEAP